MEKDKEQKCCNIHKSEDVGFIYWNQANNSLEAKCIHCIVQFSHNSQQLISLSQILKINVDDIIYNYPFVDPEKQSSIFSNLYQIAQEKKQGISILQNSVEEYYNGLKTDVIEQINKSYKSMMIRIKNLEEQQQSVLDVYNQIVTKDLLKNNVINYLQISPEEHEQQSSLMNQIERNKEQIKEITLQLEESIEKYKKLKINTQMETQDKIKESIIQHIELTEKIFTCSNSEMESVLQNNKKVDKIMCLINNGSNFCSQEQSNKLKEQIENVSFQFSFIQENEIPSNIIDFSSLPKQILNYLKRMNLVKVDICDISQIYKDKIISINNEYIKKEEDKQLFLELLNGFQYKIDLKINQKYQLIKSGYSYSQGYSTVQVNQSSIEFQCNSSNGISTCSAFLNLDIVKEKKYLFKYKIRKNSGIIVIGLIEKGKQNSNDISNQTFCQTQRKDKKDQNTFKIIKGQLLSVMDSDNQLYEMRICLNDNYFRVSDHPYYENVNQLERKIDQTKTYLFGFQMSEAYSVIELVDAQVVQEFDDKFD